MTGREGRRVMFGDLLLQIGRPPTLGLLEWRRWLSQGGIEIMSV